MARSPRTPLAYARVLDEPAREGDHIYASRDPLGRQLIGSVPADWQRDPDRRLRASLPVNWKTPTLTRMHAPLPTLGDPIDISDELTLYEVLERPAFVAPGSGFTVSHEHDDPTALEQVRLWYRSAWEVISLARFIEQVLPTRVAAAARYGEDSSSVAEIDVQLSQARVSITRNRATLARFQRELAA